MLKKKIKFSMQDIVLKKEFEYIILNINCEAHRLKITKELGIVKKNLD